MDTKVARTAIGDRERHGEPDVDLARRERARLPGAAHGRRAVPDQVHRRRSSDVHVHERHLAGPGRRHRPGPANNHAQTSFTVECIVPVAINIHPGSFKNPINLKSERRDPGRGADHEAGEYGLPLAFDATKIQPLTTRFGRRRW